MADVALDGSRAYFADARALRLPLWNYLLGRLGLLAWAEPLGRVFTLGALTLLAALATLAWDLARHWSATATPAARPER